MPWRKTRGRVVGALALAVAAIAAFTGGGVGSAASAPGPGSLLAFGAGGSGQLGNAEGSNPATANPTPGLVALPGAVGPVTGVSGGGTHSLVVTASGQLYSFGGNYFGQLGNTTNVGANTANPTPTLVALPGAVGGVTQVAAGSGQSLAVTSGGQLFAFGYNDFGQLGFAANNAANPTPVAVGLPGEIGGVTQVATAEFHSLAVTSSDQLYAFGLNNYGQLGSTTNNTTLTPVLPAQVTLPGEIGTITQVAVGAYHSLVVTSSGQLYAFGINGAGQLGTSAGMATPNPTPALVSLPGAIGGVTQVAAGENHSLAVTASGQLYAFGDNQFGQLGNVTNNTTHNPNPTPTLVTLAGQVGPVTQIAAGVYYSLAVTASGQVYGFGGNEYGPLGTATNNLTSNPNPVPALAQIPPGATIDTVARAPESYHALALVSDLAITTGALPSGQAGAPYAIGLAAAGGTSPMKWSASGLPAGLAIDPATGAIGGTPTVAGSFSATVTLSDVYGSTAAHTFALSVAPAAAVVPPTVVATAPRLTALKQSARMWLLGSKLPSLNGTAKPVKRRGVSVGTTFSFNLDQAARVTLTFRHTMRGRTVSGKCVALTKGNAGKPVCLRTLGEGTLRVQARKGANKLHFEGRINRAVKLKSGPHSVTISAGAAGKTSKPASLSFAAVSG